MKKIREFIKNLKLFPKFMLVYTLIFGLFCLVSIGTLQIAISVYEDKLYEKSEQELQYFVKLIDAEFARLENTSYNVAMDFNIQKQLTELMQQKERYKYFSKLAEVKSLLLTQTWNTDFPIDITYVDGKDILFSTGKTYYEPSDEVYNDIYKKAREARGSFVYLEPDSEFPYLISGRDILKYSDMSLSYLGTLILTCDLDTIVRQNLDELHQGTSNLCIMSGDNIIYSTDEELFRTFSPMKEQAGYQIQNIKGQKYFVSWIKSDKNNWQYINMVSYNKIYWFNIFIRILVIGTLILLFLLLMFLTQKLFRRIIHPLEELTVSMQIVDSGEFEKAKEYLGSDFSGDEIGLLKQDFKIMLDKIMILMHENYEKQIVLKDTQYKALQAQINPHFLYNTLNSVSWMVLDQRSSEASEMLVSLGDLLRASISSKSLATIEEELGLLEHYLVIQKIRYRERASFHISKTGELEGYMVPRMILQPLVENAIIHGVEESDKYCVVQVTLWEEKETLWMKVADDGAGIEPEDLLKIQSREFRSNENSIGLQNIIKRLELIFGKSAHMQIKSEVGKGTEVSIEIPKKG